MQAATCAASAHAQSAGPSRPHARSTRTLAQQLASLICTGRTVRSAVHALCASTERRAIVLRLLHSLAVLASPVIAYLLLDWFSDERADEWIGYTCVAGLATAGVIAALMRRASLSQSLLAGLDARDALCALAFVRAAQLEWEAVAASRGVHGDARPHSKDDTPSNAPHAPKDAMPRHRADALEAGGECTGAGIKAENVPMQPASSQQRSKRIDSLPPPLGQLSELIGGSAALVLEYFTSRTTVLLLLFEICGSLAVLLWLVGIAALLAVSCMLVVMVVGNVAGALLERAVNDKTAAQASFLALLGEVLGGIYTLRTCGWVGHYEERLRASADAVRVHATTMLRLSAAVDPLNAVSVDLLSVIIASALVFVLDTSLDPATVTGYWIQLALLHGRMLEFPVALASYRQGRAAIDSFARFLSRPSSWMPLGLRPPEKNPPGRESAEREAQQEAARPTMRHSDETASARACVESGPDKTELVPKSIGTQPDEAEPARESVGSVAQRESARPSLRHTVGGCCGFVSRGHARSDVRGSRERVRGGAAGATVSQTLRDALVAAEYVEQCSKGHARSEGAPRPASEAVVADGARLRLGEDVDGEAGIDQPSGSRTATAAVVEAGNAAGLLAQPHPRPPPACEVRVTDGCFGWGSPPSASATKPAGWASAGVACCSLLFPAGSLTVIHGEAAAGKSTLLFGLLGETTRRGARIEFDASSIRPSVALVAQTPWLLAGSIRDNILFGSSGEFDAERYAAACRACCLVEDLDRLPEGDQTDVGEGGERLSGGQRQRVSLARAAYSHSPLVLLDDPLSALDAHVGKTAFEECILGLMAGRTRILCTHSEQLAACADQVIVVERGEARAVAVTPSLCARYAYGESHGVSLRERRVSLAAGGHESSALALATPSITQLPIGVRRDAQSDRQLECTHPDARTPSPRRRLARVIHAVLGHCRIVGDVPTACAVALAFGCEVLAVEVGVYILTDYAEASEEGNADNLALGLYALTVLAEVAFAYGRMALLSYGAHRAHAAQERSLLHGLLHAEMSYYDETPSAEVLTLFSADLEGSNALAVMQAYTVLGYGVFYWAIMVGAFCAYLPWLAFAVVPSTLGLIALIYKYEVLQRDAGQDADAGLFGHYVQLLAGLPTIRAGYCEPTLLLGMHAHLDECRASTFARHEKVFGLYMAVELLAAAFLASVAVAVTAYRGSIGSGLAGFLLLNAGFSLPMFFMIVTREVDVANIASHRRRLWTAAPAPDESEWGTAEPAFAGACGLHLDAISLAYSPLPAQPVVNELSLTIAPGQHVGIVGRSGSGKSTLVRALARLLRPRSGSIYMRGSGADGGSIDVDLSLVSEQALRSLLCVVPQSPTIFSGTLRSNLDPRGLYTDEALLRACERARLKAEWRISAGSLLAQVSSQGLLMSAGERQLLCLARALVAGARLIVLDEATSSLSEQLVETVQTALRECAEGATVIQIAHQTTAVMRCQRVLVFAHGDKVEDGSPQELLGRADGVFAGMVQRDTRRTLVAD